MKRTPRVGSACWAAMAKMVEDEERAGARARAMEMRLRPEGGRSNWTRVKGELTL